jgi:hypothetical protein
VKEEKILTESSALLGPDLQSLTDLVNWFEHDVMGRKYSYKVPLFKLAGISASVLGSAYVGVQSYHFGDRYVSFGAGIALSILAAIPIAALTSKPFLSVAEDVAYPKSSHERKLGGRSNCNRGLAKNIEVFASAIPGSITAGIFTYINHTQFLP